MSKRNETPAVISIRLKVKEKADFQKACLRKDRTVSQMIRDYIRKCNGKG